MRIKLSARNPQNLLITKAVLLNDGWVESDDAFIHHDIKTQQEARQRLHELGLLTSKTVNIHIEMFHTTSHSSN